MRVTVATPPATEPITTAADKTHLRVEHSADDTYIGTLITAARRAVERLTGRTLVSTGYIVYLDASEVPASGFVLPGGPVSALTEFAYYTSAAFSAVSSTAYQLAGDVVRISETADASGWPAFERGAESARFTYTAGYGAAAAVPEDLKHALKMLVAHYYEHRIPQGQMADDVEELLAPYVSYAYG
jgi:uncharacterized phiE125 gp8 family phage protein